MSIIPDDELKRCGSLNLAPMVDFLFLIVAVFATLAVTRTALFDRDIQLVKVQPVNEESPLLGHNEIYTVNLSINDKGEYKWITEFNEYLIASATEIQKELKRQQQLGLLPKESRKTRVLLHIDKAAQWEPIVQAIFNVKQSGFEIHPVYDLDDSHEK